MALRIDFHTAINAAMGDTPGLAVIHSSIAALAPPAAVTQWDALYAIGRLVDAGWTLAFPAFTFSFTRTGAFDPDHTPSEVGILADWVQAGFPAAKRTDHPIYSFVVIGPQAGAICDCVSETTFGDTSPFGIFEAQNASVVMLGADWSFCTPFHRYEELGEVTYRYFKTFAGEITKDDTAAPIEAAMYVRDLDIGAANDFTPLVKRLRSDGAITSVPLWRGAVEVVQMQSIRDAATDLLASDGLAFVGNRAIAQHRMTAMAEAARLAPFRIALMGSSNLDIAAGMLGDQLRDLMVDRTCTVYVPLFGQMAQSVMMPNSELADFNAELTIFADRIEDLLGVPSLSLADPQIALDAAAQYAGLIQHHYDQNGSDVIVHRFGLTGRVGIAQGAVLLDLITQCNRVLDDTLGALDRIIWIDPAPIAANVDTVFDARLWHIGRIPFAQPYSAALTRQWAGAVLALLGKTARLLVLDLDHTLWGGVLGEDGPEGIAIGGDFPGNAFTRFQQTLKSFSDAGIALAVCSKNDEDLAIATLQDHDNMVIRPDDLVAHRINWQPKWQNIQEIAAEMDLGLGSVMFIDDNPVEREAVKLNLPMVKVLDLPQDVTAYTDTFLDSPYIQSVRIGKEDRKRVASYKARKKINLERSSAASIEDFLAGLDMQLFVQKLDGDNIARAAQLCQKTNQFNTTTRRHSARDLTQMHEQGVDVAVIGLQDKFTKRENIGLIILTPDADDNQLGHVDLMLLSCRVLGRTVEQAIMKWALGRAHTRGWDHLRGEIIETPRNTPARRVFADCGFDAIQGDGAEGHTHWQHAAENIPLPDWFDVHDAFTAQ